MAGSIRTIGVLVLLGLAAPLAAHCQSTPDDRAALFDYILAKTLEREAFSPVKNRALGLDVEGAMLQLRQEVIAANTQQALYYALAKLSSARKDRHLRVGLVDGGIAPGDTSGTTLENYPVAGASVLHAPIRFAADYETPGGYFLFVSDVASNIAELSGGRIPAVGDSLVTINGRSLEDYVEAIEPYHRYSTVNGFWWQLASWASQRSYQFPPELYREGLQLDLRGRNGEWYSLTLPYLAPEAIEWEAHGAREYSAFSQVFSTSTFDLFRSDARPILLLRWHGFREHLVDDIDRLLEYAESEGLLDHAVIVDATRSRGGSLGAYAVRRLSPRPFRTTFGNVRISDVIPAFIEERQARFAQYGPSSRRPGEVDDGSWLMAWLEDDVTRAIEAGQRYSNDVPFKLAHLPKYSDGIIEPASVHFRGRLVCWFSPYGGSHLDQFASIVIDNELGYTLGMPAGGYSNTWEWEEVLHFPLSGGPVVEFMWSIGHTVRPNGEILEGNAAQVDEFIPVTRDNYESYYELLLSRTLQHLEFERPLP
jgi:hypothetical protein